MQTVQTSLLPFHLHRKTLEVPDGLTIQEIVDFIFPNKIKGVEIVVNIGDHVIPECNWKRVRPKPMMLVGVNAVAAGGKGGKKNPLATVLSIALVVAAPYIAPYIAGAAMGTSAATASFMASAGVSSFTTAMSVARIGIGIVGLLATSMLSSTPRQSARSSASPSEASSQFIEGASNKIDRYGAIPVNLGVNRMFPPQAALPYTETVANKQYARQMFTYGFGKVQITERRLGETLLSEYDGVEMNDRLEADLADGVSLYSKDVFQDGYSVLLTNATGYVTRTTQPDADEVDIDLTFQQGLTEFTKQGQRVSRSVDFVVQYAVTGTGNWSYDESDNAVSSQSVSAEFPPAWDKSLGKRIGYNILALNLFTGVVSVIKYDKGATPIIPDDNIRIASFQTESTSVTSGGSADIVNLVDERAAHIPSRILNSTDFAFTYGGSGLSISVAAGTIVGRKWRITDSTAEALRVSRNIKFPTRDQYDVRIKRLTNDSSSERVRDQATLTAIRSIRQSSPVLQPDISGTAMRMLATDQLNGTVNSYNCIVSTLAKDYDSVGDQWIEDVITSNPASIYRYVLQTPAFVKNLADERIDLDKLQEWHIFCEENSLTYNKIVDQQTSVDELLNDIAAAGMATIHKINGIYSVIIDNERPTIKGLVTPRNSWGYTGSITYPDLPHALRVQFRNKEKGYFTDERIVYADGYTEENATLFERLQFDSCTDADLAWFYGRRYLATALLQPESHTFNMDFENLTFNRGDKIVLVNDVILVGVGQGRIKELVYDDPDTPTEVLGFVIDDVVNIPTSDQFGVRIRHGDASGFIYYSLDTVVGETDEFTFTTPVPYASRPPIGSLCAFTEFGEELELIVTEIRMNKDHSAAITAINYAPERFNATTGAIPAFDSKITTPVELTRPSPPELDGEIRSDESVMIKNSDGSYTTRMLIPLRNKNESTVIPLISIRPVGATQWSRPDTSLVSPDIVVLTGLEDGRSYDIQISYQRATGLRLVSLPLYLGSTVFEGASARPSNVSGFRVSATESIGLFEWVENSDIDISHYEMRFSSLTSGATWASSQVVADNIKGNRISLPIQLGTYLIKAVDILDNESLTAAVITSFNEGVLNDVVENLEQHPSWAGSKTNMQVVDDELYLTDPTEVGYYYFDPEPFDLSEIYESVLSSSIVATGVFYNRVRSMVSIRDEASIRGISGSIIRDVTSIRDMDSVRGLDPSDWLVRLEIRTSDDNVTWSDWETFAVGKYIFRYVKFRLYVESLNPNVNVKISSAAVVINMPDRVESDDDVECTASGLEVVYDGAFKNNPSVNITLQDGAVDDRLEYVYKTSAGFHVKVYNATSAGYVTRNLDYTATGYGRVVT